VLEDDEMYVRQTGPLWLSVAVLNVFRPARAVFWRNGNFVQAVEEVKEE